MDFGKRGIQDREDRLDSKAGKRFRKIALGLLQLLLVAFIGVGVAGSLLAYGAFRGIIDSSPDIGSIDVSPKGFSSFIYDADGNETAKLVSSDSNRIPVGQDMITDDLAHAFVAIEDERFYTHRGIDVPGIIRAAVKGISSGNFDEGASTITQQLIKNNVFPEFTSETFTERFKRKFQEQYLALSLEKTMSKDQILLNYLNTINMGHSTLGVEAASQRYFDKSCNELTLSECTVLAAIPQNPTQFDPIIYPEWNAERRQTVLDYMLEQDYITKDAYEEALADNVYERIKEINVEKVKEDNRINSYFDDALIEQVLNDLQDDAGYSREDALSLIYSGGLKIYSTQDPDIQKIADRACAENSGNYPSYVTYYMSYSLTVINEDGTTNSYYSGNLVDYLKSKGRQHDLKYTSKDKARKDCEDFRKSLIGDSEDYAEVIDLAPQPEISLTVAENKTGHIVAMVGGRGTKSANMTLNRATDTMRQPGSTFKVLSTFAPALDSGKYTLASSQVDEPFKYANGVQCRNWYSGYRGRQTFRSAIRDSLNIVTVKTLTAIGPAKGYEYLEKFGITTLVDNYEIDGKIYTDMQQTLALGGLTFGVKNVELNAAYATIANKGVYIEPKMYTKVLDHDGNVLLDSSETAETHRVLKESTAWLLTSAMKDCVTKGTGTVANFGSTAIAGKTGTTNDDNDVWFSGYTNTYTASVWAGYDDNRHLSSYDELNLAMVIWRQVMREIPANKNWKDFPMPDGISTRTVCRTSGKTPLTGYYNCPTITEYFAKGTAPSKSTKCDVHQKKYEEAKKKAQEEAKKKEEEEKKKAEEEAKKKEEDKDKKKKDD